MRQRPVLVRTPLSRRRVLFAVGGAATVVGVLKGVTWWGRPPEPSSRPVSPVSELAIAIPTGGDGRDAYTNRPLLAAAHRVLGDVEQAGQGRFHLTVQEVAQPEPPPPKTAATPTPQIVVLAPLLASGAAPDLLALTSHANPGVAPEEFAFVADPRALLPLDNLWKGRPPLTLRDVSSAALDVCRQNGKLLGLPVMGSPWFLTYDERRFQTAGVAPPDATWGWTDLLTAARRLTHTPVPGGTPDQYGYYPYPAVASLLTCIWQNGGEVTNTQQTQARLTTPAVREAVTFLASFYTDPPSSPSDSFQTWRWDGDGVRVNDHWWAAMVPAPAPAGFGADAPANFLPPVPTAAELMQRSVAAQMDSLPDASSSQAAFPSPMRFAPLPKGRQRATMLGVTATISVSHTTSAPDVAAVALGLLAEHVTMAVVPSVRRLPTAVMQRLAPSYTTEQIQLLADALDASRALLTGDVQRTARLRASLGNSLVVPIQTRTSRPLDDLLDAANRAVQAILDAP